MSERYQVLLRCVTKTLKIIIVALTLSQGSSAHADDKVPVRPRIALDQRSYDFGRIVEGTKVSHDFVLKNQGDAALVIQRVIPACGCTISSIEKESIDPKDSGKIHVEFDSTGFSGEREKSIRVLTNDPDHPSVDLMLRGLIERDLLIEPGRVAFDEVAKSKVGNQSRDILVAIREGASSSITAIKSFSKNITVEELKSSPKSRHLRVSLTGDLALGEFRDRIVVEVSGKRTRSINIPVYALIVGDVRINPSSLSFGVIQPESILERSVKIENLGAHPISVNRVESDNPLVTASAITIESGKRYVLKVKIDPKMVKKSQELRALITITTENESLPLLVYGIVPAANVQAAKARS